VYLCDGRPRTETKNAAGRKLKNRDFWPKKKAASFSGYFASFFSAGAGVVKIPHLGVEYFRMDHFEMA
jgi:hypothetical protein